MTKSEWSGWVQAIGSILAIWGAFRLSQRVVEREQRRALELVLNFGGSLIAVVTAISKLWDERGPQSITLVAGNAKGAGELGSSVPLHQVPAPLIPVVFGLRTLADETLELIQGIEAHKEPPHRDYVVQLLEHTQDQVSKLTPYLPKKDMLAWTSSAIAKAKGRLRGAS